MIHPRVVEVADEHGMPIGTFMPKATSGPRLVWEDTVTGKLYTWVQLKDMGKLLCYYYGPVWEPQPEDMA